MAPDRFSPTPAEEGGPEDDVGSDTTRGSRTGGERRAGKSNKRYENSKKGGGGGHAGAAEESGPPLIDPASDPLGAALAFSEGLDYLDRQDIPRAREALRRAVELDPGLDDARAELSRIDL